MFCQVSRSFKIKPVLFEKENESQKFVFQTGIWFLSIPRLKRISISICLGTCLILICCEKTLHINILHLSMQYVNKKYILTSTLLQFSLEYMILLSVFVEYDFWQNLLFKRLSVNFVFLWPFQFIFGLVTSFKQTRVSLGDVWGF